MSFFPFLSPRPRYPCEIAQARQRCFEAIARTFFWNSMKWGEKKLWGLKSPGHVKRKLVSFHFHHLIHNFTYKEWSDLAFLNISFPFMHLHYYSIYFKRKIWLRVASLFVSYLPDFLFSPKKWEEFKGALFLTFAAFLYFMANGTAWKKIESIFKKAVIRMIIWRRIWIPFIFSFG